MSSYIIFTSATASPPLIKKNLSLIDFSSFLHLLFLESGVAAARCNGVSSLDLARSEDVTHVDAARRKGVLSTVRVARSSVAVP